MLKSTTGRPFKEPTGWWLQTEHVRTQPSGRKTGLATQSKALDQLQVTVTVFPAQVVQQFTTLVYHADQTTAGMMILLVDLKVTLQLVDVGAQQCNLHFWRAGIAISLLIILNDLCFFIGRKCHNSPHVCDADKSGRTAHLYSPAIQRLTTVYRCYLPNGEAPTGFPHLLAMLLQAPRSLRCHIYARSHRRLDPVF